MDPAGIASFLERELASEDAWRRAIDALYLSYRRLVEEADRHLSDEDVGRLLSVLVILVAQIGFRTPERKAQLFSLAQHMGVHVLPVHYYSPVPDTSALPSRLWSRHRAIADALDLDLDRQLEFLDRVSRWSGELTDVPDGPLERGFFWDNPQLYRNDAALYYCTVREYRPATVVEVGGGFSTMIAGSAAARNGGGTKLVCIEPEPRPELREGFPGLAQLIQAPLQDVDVGLFESLGAGDILFVDGSHVSKIGSDVNHLFADVLPRLKPGVLLHFHDVFTPHEYPERWVKELQAFWNEQYLLEAFMLYNAEFEALCVMNYLAEAAPEAVCRALSVSASAGGSSAWLRRRIA